jgi:hypothetical protein
MMSYEPGSDFLLHDVGEERGGRTPCFLASISIHTTCVEFPGRQFRRYLDQRILISIHHCCERRTRCLLQCWTSGAPEIRL